MFKKFILLFLLALSFNSCEKEVETVIDRFTLEQNTFTEADNNTTISIKVYAQGTIGETISVPYTIDELSAKFTDDLLNNSGILEFSPESNEAIIEVELVGDDFFELEERFQINLDYEGNWNLTISIADDDEIGAINEDDEGFYTPAEYPSMSLKWSDEFDGTELDQNSWTFELGDGCDKNLCGWGNNELQSYTNDPGNITVEDGRVTITALNQFETYTSARVITQDKVELQYGRIDIRAKMPKGQGIWPALWMLGANIDQVSWPSCGEIDIMELVGHEPEITHGTVHYNENGHRFTGGARALTEGDLSDKFHVYSIVWERDKITWYLDNFEYFNFTRSQTTNYPFNAPFFFIMNIAIGGNWPGNPDNSTVFPQEMVVDYIRVFE